MNYRLVPNTPRTIQTELLCLARAEGRPLEDKRLEQELKRRSFRPGLGKSVLLPPPRGYAARNILVVGLGKPREHEAGAYATAAAVCARRAEETAVKKVALAFPSAGGTERWLQAAVEGCELGLYRFKKYLSKDHDAASLREVKIRFEGSGRKAARAAVERGRLFSEYTKLARDLVCEPSGYLTPERMVEIAVREGRKAGLKVKVVDEKQAGRMGMGCLLGVGQGSAHPPRLIHLSFRASRKDAPRLGLLGKGITFDSGGLSLKSAKHMETMKEDMAGAATVLATLLGAARLRPDVHLEGVMCMAENMPSGHAIRPGDVLRSMSGKTVEVVNTDAEGRLVLADGLTYLHRQKVSAVIDLATLTGACVVALGEKCAGLVSADAELSNGLLEAARLAGECIAPLPLIEEYRESLRSPIADIKNCGDGWGGAITAALFLSEFVEPGMRWAHLDIAGPAYATKDTPLARTGGTGFGVRTLLTFLTSEAALASLRKKPKRAKARRG